MKAIDIKKLTAILASMCVVYNKEISEELVDLYFKSLREFEIGDVSVAFSAHAKISQFFPKPADILILLERDRESKKALALAEFKRVIYLACTKHPDERDSVEIKNSTVEVVIKNMGGLAEICKTYAGNSDKIDRNFKFYHDEITQNGMLRLAADNVLRLEGVA